MATKRLFLSLPLNDAIQKALLAFLEKNQHIKIRFIPPQNWHVTALYLGEVDIEKIPELKKAVAECCKQIEPFSLNFESIKAFPTFTRPQMIWGNLQSNLAFERLATLLQKACESFSHAEIDNRNPLPHVTLARLKPWDDIRNMRFPEADVSIPLQAETIDLYESILGPNGAQYEKLDSFHLK